VPYDRRTGGAKQQRVGVGNANHQALAAGPFGGAVREVGQRDGRGGHPLLAVQDEQQLTIQVGSIDLQAAGQIGKCLLPQPPRVAAWLVELGRHHVVDPNRAARCRADLGEEHAQPRRDRPVRDRRRETVEISEHGQRRKPFFLAGGSCPASGAVACRLGVPACHGRIELIDGPRLKHLLKEKRDLDVLISLPRRAAKT
jgi:hypothetical protein